MLTLNVIYEIIYDLHQRNPQSPGQVEFELHWQANGLKIKNDVNNRKFRPESFTFVADYPIYREIFTSDKKTGVLQRLLCSKFTPILEKVLCENVHNNRIGKGTIGCINSVLNHIYEITDGYRTDGYILKLDIKGCFPNINLDIAYDKLKNLLLNHYKEDDLDDMLYILQVCIFSYPTKHCIRKSPIWKWKNIKEEKSLFSKQDGIGAPLGYELNQKMVLYFFSDIDWYLYDLHILFDRYVDDIYIFSKSKAILSIIPQIRDKMKELGATLHPNKFYFQHYTKGMECLGKHIKKDRIYTNNRIIRKAIERVKYYNKHINEDNILPLISTINSYLSHCKQGNGYNQAKKIIKFLDKKWMKYVHFNKKRLTLQRNDEYSHRKVIIKKYNLL
ncbi:MAG: reverse transcriptase domain-containing protein [Alphaproteobacteria bacterium]